MNPILNVEELSSTQVGSYCSNGFRNVNYSFSDFSLEEKILKSNLHVDFSKYSLSEPWLIKQSFQPHLRTTEYVVIAVLMSELYLSLALKISQEELAKSWVKQVKLKSSPQFAINSIQPISVSRKKFFNQFPVFVKNFKPFFFVDILMPRIKSRAAPVGFFCQSASPLVSPAEKAFHS